MTDILSLVVSEQTTSKIILQSASYHGYCKTLKFPVPLISRNSRDTVDSRNLRAPNSKSAMVYSMYSKYFYEIAKFKGTKYVQVAKSRKIRALQYSACSVVQVQVNIIRGANGQAISEAVAALRNSKSLFFSHKE